MTTAPILYFAPGGGLGHLNRGLAICLRLRQLAADARVVTDSPFAEGLAALARLPILRIPRTDWPSLVHRCVAELRPRAVIADTFPYGIREEWRNQLPAVPFIHIARRLREPIPLNPAHFACIVQAEPLSPEQESNLGPAVLKLRFPILLPPGAIPTPIPPSLAAEGQILIVHSGPPEELNQLIALAPGPSTVISPWSGTPYYPAANLYSRAAAIITGAGYNAMADGLAFRDRHRALPFHRRYDDQNARLHNFFTEPGDSTEAAAFAILSAIV